MNLFACLSSDLPDGVTAGAVVVSLAADAEAQAWIKITPRGTVETRPGAKYTFDPETLAARFARDDVKLAIDFDHAIAKLAAQGQKADAIGWIEELQARPDGLYGRVEWLATGKAALAAKTHRYVSPTFLHDEDNRATWLHSVALVTAPALSGMPALASAHTHSENTMSKKIATALGLAETADEAACLAAIGTLKTSTAPAGMVALAVHNETLTTLAATKGELDTLKKEGRDKTVNDLLEGALKAKKIVPAQRDHYATLCATDDGLKQVTALLAATPEGLKASGLDNRGVQDGQDQDVNPVTLAAEITKRMGQASKNGTTLTYTDALAQIQAEKK